MFKYLDLVKQIYYDWASYNFNFSRLGLTQKISQPLFKQFTDAQEGQIPKQNKYRGLLAYWLFVVMSFEAFLSVRHRYVVMLRIKGKRLEASSLIDFYSAVIETLIVN